MSDYKLVPFPPTPEMVSAAEDAYMPFGDMELAIRMAILAAPAVQGEPVGWQFYHDGKWWRWASYPNAAPQPAAHQPCPEAVREGAPYDDPLFKSLCREHEIWGTPAAAQCAVFWEAGKRVAEQRAAPDVAALVESLTELCDEIDNHDIHSAISKTNILWFKRKARAALAAHRKQKENK